MYTPEDVAVTVQVYVAELVPPTGPVTLLPQLTPVTPAIDHEPVPVGTAPPEGPVTTEVKVI